MFDLIGNFADWLDVSRDVAAQVIVSILGTVVAISAAAAAWMAARIAKLAAEEARESRLEQQRPIFEFKRSNSNLTVRWTKNDCFTVFSGRSNLSIDTKNPFKYGAQNVGTGRAVSVHYSLTSAECEDISDNQTSTLQNIFLLGGLKTKKGENQFAIYHSTGVSSALLEHPVLERSTYELDSCGVAEVLDFSILEHLSNEIRAIAIKSLAYSTLNERLKLRSNALLKFYYASVVGEKFEIPLLISFRGGLISAYGKDSYEPEVPTKEWDILDAELSFSVTRLRKIRKWSLADRNNPHKFFRSYVRA